MDKDFYLNKLIKDLERRRYADETIERYFNVTNRFLKFINNKKDIRDLNEYDAIDYLDYLTKERHYKSSSYNNVNSILKFFLEVTLEKDIGYRRMPSAKCGERQKVIPTREEVISIIESTNNIKHKCWFALAYGSGLRTFEIAKLKVTDIDSKNMKINLIGKGNKERITVLPEMTLSLLRQYCRDEGIKKGNNTIYLFKGQRKEHISEDTVARTLKNKVIKLGLDENLSMHSLRSGFATQMLKSGEKLEVVKELMGHKSITTTMGYVKVVYIDRKIKNPLDGEFYETYNSRSN